MKIIVFDHKNNIIITNEVKTFAQKFFMHADLLSSDNEIAQSYIDKWIQKKLTEVNQDILTHSEYTGIQVYNLEDSDKIKEIEPHILGPSTDYGITIISLPRREMVALTEYQDTDLLKTSFVKSLLEEGVPTWHRTLEEKMETLERISQLFEHKYIAPFPNNPIAGRVDIMEDYHTKINKYIKANHKKVFKKFPPNYYDFKISPKTTGWTTFSSPYYKTPKNYEKLFSCLHDSGLTLTKTQEKYWSRFYKKYNKTDKLNFELLEIAREKEILNQSTPQITQLSNNLSSTTVSAVRRNKI